MKSINIKYFAMLRDKTKIESETIEVNVKTYKDLYQELKIKYGFDVSEDLIQVAQNNKFVTLESEIQDQATIAFIPPVAGG